MTLSKYKLSKEELINIDQAKAQYSPEIIEIEGVVSPENGFGMPRKDFSVHIFSLTAWKIVSEKKIIKRSLIILRPVDLSEEDLKEIASFSILKLSVYLNSDRTRAILINGKKAMDSRNIKLDKIANELKKHVEINTEIFGKLNYNNATHWYEGNSKWNGERVEVSFSIDENWKIDKGLQVASEIWKEQNIWEKKVKEYAVQKLLKLKNDTWIDEEGKSVNSEEFKKLMRLESVTFESDGSFKFWYNDGDLFWGHSIHVSGKLIKGFTDAGI